MKLKKTITTTLAAIALSGAAHAATMNFQDTDVTESGVADGTVVTSITGAKAAVYGYTFGGGTITGSAGAFAYLDAPSGSKPGGLGTCNVLGTLGGVADQCNPTSDDNIEFDEAVGINFSEGGGKAVIVDSVFLRGTTQGATSGTHNVLSSGTFLWSTDGVTFTQAMTDANGIWNTGGLKLGFGELFFATDANEIYVSSIDFTPVPVPAAGLMLLTALGGMGVMRRRRNKS
jgi:hypothetical protein